jgi:prophage regulatory protein
VIEREFVDANELEQMTGICATTWRYWSHSHEGPPSLKIGRRRVWRLSTVRQWLAEREQESVS